jgi:hypothetical protein
MLNLCPAYLFIGSQKEIYDYLNENLKRIFCKSCNLNSKVNSNVQRGTTLNEPLPQISSTVGPSQKMSPQIKDNFQNLLLNSEPV